MPTSTSGALRSRLWTARCFRRILIYIRSFAAPSRLGATKLEVGRYGTEPYQLACLRHCLIGRRRVACVKYESFLGWSRGRPEYLFSNPKPKELIKALQQLTEEDALDLQKFGVTIWHTEVDKDSCLYMPAGCSPNKPTKTPRN